MKLHRDLGITQKSAWFLAHRLRSALSQDGKLFAGPVEVDETYMGGKRRNMSNAKRKALADTGRGVVGGCGGQGSCHTGCSQGGNELQGFVKDHAAVGGLH